MDPQRWICNALAVNGNQNVKTYSLFLIANVINSYLKFNLEIIIFHAVAICDPPCINGGNCLSFNVCQCPKEFRGPQCQYSVERCATTKLNFNGGFQCSGTAHVLSCKLTCPKTVNFEFQPADEYVCSYETGQFSPAKVPRCVFGKISVCFGG